MSAVTQDKVVSAALNWDVCDQTRRINRSIKTAWAVTDRNGDNLDEIHAKFLKKVGFCCFFVSITIYILMI